MTAQETVDIIRESPLWETLSIAEKAEALAYAMKSVGCRLTEKDPDDEIADIVGEIFGA